MAIELNHTIINVRDKRLSSTFYAELLGLDEPVPFGGWFLVVKLANGVSLDFIDDTESARIEPQHYAFLVSETDFDAIFARIRARNLPHWADPAKQHPNQHNTHFGGRGVYWEDPDGHFLEIITRPYVND
jgi:catechol 2,3-dioxygenase-like lactoylglutathione lyase family enzyme